MHQLAYLALAAAIPGAAAGVPPARSPVVADHVMVLRNGTVVTMDPEKPSAEAVIVLRDRIVAVGTDAEIDALTPPGASIIDLNGHTLVPGLVDTHIHAIRAGESYAWETYWYDINRLKDALASMTAVAATRTDGEWIAVAGGWAPEQFEERRAPTVDELTAAAPRNPVFVQQLYDYALVNRSGIKALRLDDPKADLPPNLSVERDAHGMATGKLTGGAAPFNALIARISPIATPDAKGASMARFFAHLNAMGVTGLIDPAGGADASYQPLFDLWRQGRLTLRTAYRLPAQKPGGEAEFFRTALAFRAPYQTDGLLTFLGIGEVLVFGMNDGGVGSPFHPTDADRAELEKVASLAAERHLPLEVHAYSDEAANAILDVFEKVAARQPIADLRWAIAHIYSGKPATFDRMRKLGVSYTVQSSVYLEAPALAKVLGDQVATTSPPTRLALERKIMVGGGTDASRASIANVWRAIEFHVTGRSAGGAVQRSAPYLLTRPEALSLYTSNAAWFTFAEHNRGMVKAGMQADLAVLDKPFLKMPAADIHSIRSLLTIVDGRPVYDRLTTKGTDSDHVAP